MILRNYKKQAALLALLLFILLLCACKKAPDKEAYLAASAAANAEPAASSAPLPASGEVSQEEISPEESFSQRALALSALAFSSEDAAQALRGEGIQILLPYASYPSSYLEDPEPLRAFCARLDEGGEAEILFARLRDENTISYQLFSSSAGTLSYACVRCENTDGEVRILDYEHYPVQEWYFTERQNFYYRLFPAGDKHYADYSLIRANAPDEALLSMLEESVLPIDYYYVNLLITDWQEGNWGEVSFSDVFDRLYALSYGREISPEDFSRSEETGFYQIPAETFEAVILSYFSLSQSELRALAGFDAQTQSYPWRPIETNDMELYYYPPIEPEITSLRENEDGTRTFFITCLSADVPTDCIFSHALTIRPGTGGRFQYVSNEISFQTSLGLPNTTPRLLAR